MLIKIKILVSLLALFSVIANGQTFTKLTSNNHGVYNGDIVLADLDRNDTLELILVGIDSAGLDVLKIYKLDTNGNLFIVKQIDIPSIKSPVIQVSDITNNGFIDLLISGNVDNKPYFTIFINNSNFAFEEYSLPLPQLNGGLLLSDFTNNGLTDFIINGGNENSTDTIEFYINKDGLFTLCDTCTFLPLKNTQLAGIDVTNNGYNDFILSGLDNADAQEFYLFQNRNNQRFDTTKLPFQEIQNPIFTKGDFTQNGFMDVAIGGKINGKDSLVIYKNSPSGFTFELGIAVEDSILKIIPADYTNDGLLDFLVLTKKQLLLYYNDGTNDYDTTLIISGITKSNFAIGDFDRDNDQDIFITGVIGDENTFILYKNDYTINTTPNSPDLLFSFPLSDSVTLQWNDGTDETTNPISLSYSAFIVGPTGSVLPIHSGNNNRALSGFGLQSLSNTITLKNLKPGSYKWFIQAVDNSLVDSFGICDGGSGFGCSWVFEIKEEENRPLNVCKGDTIKIAIDPPQPVQWFSKNRGKLSFSDTLVYITSEDDIAYANYTNADCETKTFSAYINILYTESLDVFNQEICEGETIGFDISELFDEALWYFKLQRDTIKGTTVELKPIQSDSLTVIATAENGCSISKTVFVQVNALPVINAGDDVSIFIEESTNLLATGGTSYSWSPPTGLNSSQIPNPVANPIESITYTVVGSDIKGCINQDEVVVFVKQSVFMPNLFSPNGDGSNDTFKVFGSNLQSVVLKVYDTQGKLLFESAHTSGAINIGWNGTFNGKPVPQGDYLWVISGVFQDGSKITSNGKVTGSVTLIR